MRGLAALYVLLFHLYVPVGLPVAVRHGLSWLRFGHYAVGIFIVLSGYSLMLPVVRAGDGRIPGGVVDFFKRRARRILPPYYAALVLSLALNELLHRSSFIGVSQANLQTADADLERGNIVTHLLLVHNWFPRWVYTINFTHWSVATEWQIYFLFPFLLLPIWRRWGSGWALGVGLVLGIGPLFALPTFAYWACPQYVVLFVMGMAGAAISFSSDSRSANIRRKVPWNAVALLSCLIFVLITAFLSHGILSNGEIDVPQSWAVDLLIGMAAIGVIIFCTRAVTEQAATKMPLIVRVLESPIATSLGLFSYSIYLIHVAIIGRLRNLLNIVDDSLAVNMTLMLVIGVPITLLLCYLFHLAFEQRFMRNLSFPTRMKGEIFLAGTEEQQEPTG